MSWLRRFFGPGDRAAEEEPGVVPPAVSPADILAAVEACRSLPREDRTIWAAIEAKALAAAEATAALRDVHSLVSILDSCSHKDVGHNIVEAVGSAAVRALGALGDPLALPALTKLAGRFWHPRLRKLAAETLLSLGDPRWCQWVQGDDGDFQRLAGSGDPAAFELLVRTFQGYPTNALLLNALVSTQDPRAVEPIVRAMVKKDGTQWWDLRQGLMSFQQPEAIAELTRLAAESAGKDRKLAVDVVLALSNIGNDAAAAALRTLTSVREIEDLARRELAALDRAASPAESQEPLAAEIPETASDPSPAAAVCKLRVRLGYEPRLSLPRDELIRRLTDDLQHMIDAMSGEYGQRFTDVSDLRVVYLDQYVAFAISIKEVDRSLFEAFLRDTWRRQSSCSQPVVLVMRAGT